MFDDLRPKSGSPFEEEDAPEEEVVEAVPAKPASRKRRSPSSGEVPILGMTAGQRFVLSIMLFLDVTVLGCFLLLATGAVVLR
ncbi:MAG: hypothetical protein FJ030_07305 [Chloroflexi bacterium]|nr:hypothetical protein [Chloroflexota bacterium]